MGELNNSDSISSAGGCVKVNLTEKQSLLLFLIARESLRAVDPSNIVFGMNHIARMSLINDILNQQSDEFLNQILDTASHPAASPETSEARTHLNCS